MAISRAQAFRADLQFSTLIFFFLNLVNDMTYTTEISKIQVPAFAELYEITAKNTVYRVTSFAQDQYYNGNAYLARAIKRSELGFSDKLRAVRVRVSAPLTYLFNEYIANAPPELAQVKILRKIVDSDTDIVQLFLGHVVGITIENNIASAECESETRLLRNKVPRYVFQAYCNHMLFDAGCTLLEGNFSTSAVLTAVNGSQIKAAAFDAQPDGYFRLGYVRYQNDLRLITQHVGDTLTLQIPFPSLAIGTTVTAYPGCDKSFETCQNKFNNLANRLAFDNIPSSNPCIFGLR